MTLRDKSVEGQVTKSEQICNEVGAKFFCKDFVYENLKYYNESNKRVELCDALFEYGSIYVPLQIKERSKNKGGKSENSWLDEIVYVEAFEQIKATSEAIRTNNIEVNDLYHQAVKLNKNNLIFPLIVFDNPSIDDYQRVIIDEELKINVFKLEDYESMMNVIIHPYDIIYYLQERVNWVHNHTLPNIVIGESLNGIFISNVKTEEDFSAFFKRYIYDGQDDKQREALRHLALIGSFRERQMKRNPNYKQIVKILQLVEPKIASDFMARFDYAWACACQNKFDYTKAIQVRLDGKSTSIVFFSIGRRELSSKDYYQILCDAKQQQHKADAVLLIVFIGNENGQCRNDWVYFEKEYVADDKVLKFYEEIGMFNGLMDFDIYEQLCEKMLKN